MCAIKVLLAEDEQVVRAAIATFLAQESDLEVVGQVAQIGDLTETLERLQPNVLLIVLNTDLPRQDTLHSYKRSKPRVTEILVKAVGRGNDRPCGSLTERELEVLRLMAAWGVFSSLLLAARTYAVIIFPDLAEIVTVLYYGGPIFLFELTIGFWLLFKGLRSSGIARSDQATD